jgi:putative ABC transport system permease protein
VRHEEQTIRQHHVSNGRSPFDGDSMSSLRLALRSLLRRPAFCAVVVLTLALGIGATGAIFTVVQAVLLTPLPYRASDRLAMIWSRWSNFDKTWISAAEYADYKRQSALFDDVAAWESGGETAITGDGVAAESVPSVQMTANFLDVVGVAPAAGRGFTALEDVPNGPDVALVGYELWMRRWAGDRALVGRTIDVAGRPTRVVGVLPREFRFPLEFQVRRPAQIVTPMGFDPSAPDRGGHCCYGVARLKAGVTASTVSRELAALAARWTTEGLYPKDMRFTAFAVSLPDEISGKVRVALAVLAAAVALLLLLTCANVANLVLTRADSRSREVAVRAALGAGIGDIIRLSLTESLILGVAGGALGLGFAWGGVRLLVLRAPTTIPRIGELAVDWRVVAFTLALSVGTGVLFGLVPLARVSRLDLADALRDGRGQSGGLGKRRARSALVVAEMALAVLLLIGAGLTIRSFVNLTRINAGFDAGNVFTTRLSLPAAKYATIESANGFYRTLGDAVRQLPGVRAAGFVRLLPLADEMGDSGMRIKGKPLAANEPGRQADWQAVSPGYFEAMKIRLVKGRLFDQRDVAAGQPVIAITEQLAKEYFPGEDPIGQGIQVGRDTVWRTVIAVMGDVHHNGLVAPPKRGFYLPQEQWATAFGLPRRSMTLVVRTAGDPRAVLEPVRAIVHGMDADLPLTQVTTMSDVLAGATQEQRFTMGLMAAFAALALVLASVGIYGVISYSVSQRTREIGIRIALGADARGVRALVMRQGMMPAALGIALGLVSALGVTRFLGTILYGVAPVDAATFTVIPVVLLVVAAGSVLIPAVRAARVEPVEALREE